MARAQIKIFIAVFALVFLGAIVVGAFYAWEKLFKPEMSSQKELDQEFNANRPKSDPGKAVFAQAMDLIRGNELDAAKEKLKQIISVYPDSEQYLPSRKVIGEMNIDRLFSRAPMPGKLEFTVSRELGLEPIAKKNRTTIAFIRRINNMGRTVIHPGDRLILYPLDFEMEVRVAEKRLTLTQRGDFFKDFSIKDFDLPAGSKLPQSTNIASKTAYVSGKQIRDSDERYVTAEKWLQTTGKTGKPGVIFCAEPKKKDDGTHKGIYLDEADMEELNTIVRVGIPVKFIK